MDSGTRHTRLWYIEHFATYRNRIINAMWYEEQGYPFRISCPYPCDDITGYRACNSYLQDSIVTRSCNQPIIEEDFARHCLEYFLEEAPGRIRGIKMTLHSFCEWYKGLYLQEGVLASVRNNMEADFLEQADKVLNFELDLKYLKMASAFDVFTKPRSMGLWLNADIDEAEYMNIRNCTSCYLQGASFPERVKHEDDYIEELETIHLPEWTKDHQEEQDVNGFTEIVEKKPYFKWDDPRMRLPKDRFKIMGDLVAFDAKYHPYASPFLSNTKSVSSPQTAEPQETPPDATGTAPETEPDTGYQNRHETGQVARLQEPAQQDPYAHLESWEQVALEGGLIRKPTENEQATWNTLENRDKRELRWVLVTTAGTLPEVIGKYPYCIGKRSASGHTAQLLLYCMIHNQDITNMNMAYQLRGHFLFDGEPLSADAIKNGIRKATDLKNR